MLGIVDRWAEVNRIEQFFLQAEQKIAGLDEDSKEILLERLGRARDMVGNLDALDQLLKWRTPDEC